MNKPDQTINDYIQKIDDLEKALEIAFAALGFYERLEPWIDTNDGDHADYASAPRIEVATQALKEIKGE